MESGVREQLIHDTGGILMDGTICPNQFVVEVTEECGAFTT
jgi:hypothetical protein